MRETNYDDGRILVYHEDGVRNLYIDGQCQGRMYDDGLPASKYMIDIINYLTYETQYKDVLMIGGGGFIIPYNLHKFGFNVDVVEPDPKITELAHSFFKTYKTKVFEVEAQKVIDHLEMYDVIILDAYNGKDVVAELYSSDFYSKCFEHLNKDGVLITNDTRLGYNRLQYYTKE